MLRPHWGRGGAGAWGRTAMSLGTRDVAWPTVSIAVRPHAPAWPTVSSMVVAGKRLMILWNGQVANATTQPWAIPSQANVLSSPKPADGTSREPNGDFTCIDDRAPARADGDAVYKFSAFAVGKHGMADVTEAQRINSLTSLYNQANICWKKAGQRPTLIMADFVGPVTQTLT